MVWATSSVQGRGHVPRKLKKRWIDQNGEESAFGIARNSIIWRDSKAVDGLRGGAEGPDRQLPLDPIALSTPMDWGQRFRTQSGTSTDRCQFIDCDSSHLPSSRMETPRTPLQVSP